MASPYDALQPAGIYANQAADQSGAALAQMNARRARVRQFFQNMLGGFRNMGQGGQFGLNLPQPQNAAPTGNGAFWNLINAHQNNLIPGLGGGRINPAMFASTPKPQPGGIGYEQAPGAPVQGKPQMGSGTENMPGSWGNTAPPVIPAPFFNGGQGTAWGQVAPAQRNQFLPPLVNGARTYRPPARVY